MSPNLTQLIERSAALSPQERLEGFAGLRYGKLEERARSGERLAAGRFPPGLCGCAPVGFPDHGSAPSSSLREGSANDREVVLMRYPGCVRQDKTVGKEMAG
ncbi:hypothetical protein [Chamaesiphon minutus]|uniref:Uncharacterized protein n=1 Tax=Chamaesiphon minutus (strain ATCC 27169 / PCC 6605) TaxID=1173020 RepID=K9UM44_CHAP6|nr:hypothetical protein [Chamaesiphon minutus]AFY95728.1 hypothetical protein Cha6605_4815 [Chamaesiphon minutus PCC 6605]